MIRNRPARRFREPLPDVLIAIAHLLDAAATANEALDTLSQQLRERAIPCALLAETPDGNLTVERATLPIATDVWGKSLSLPRLAGAMSQRRPLIERDARAAFTMMSEGAPRLLLTAQSQGALVAAPIKLPGDRRGLLCLVSPDLREQDAAAVSALAFQLSAVLRRTATRSAQGPTPDLPVFDELTRRLSYSLTGDQIARTGIEVLAPALGFQIAAVVLCRGNEDFATIYSTADVPAGIAATTASTATDAFVRLTGDTHIKCERPPFHAVRLAQNGPSRLLSGIASSLDAPLVTNGEVTGLLRIASDQPDVFDAARRQTFFTVANQLSLALERAAAQQLSERAHLASLADSMPDGVVLIDATLRVTSLNAAAAQQLSELTGAPVDAGASIAGTELAQVAGDALASQKQTAPRELTTDQTPSGRRYLSAIGAPLANSPEGSAVAIILRDVTEDRLMQERLLQSEKMVSVGQLVSGVAHELNNPLTGIMGFAQLLLARDLDESTRRDIDTIYGEAERAAKIVQNLLSFARRRRADKELVNLNVLLERVLELRNYDLRVKNIEVDLDLDPKLPETMVDANQIQQVFLNVIINAEQAMLAEQDEGRLTVQTRREGNNIRIVFRDTGPGMDAETLRRIFDPFFTTKDTGEGTGLGLTISYGIIEGHGGKIWAESQPGRGSTFTIELPILQGREGPARPEEVELEATVTPRSILVVDDEQSIQRLLGSILELDGHQVETARNGVEALDLLGRRHYDVVITDIKMPDMDGRELYDRLMKLDSSLAHRTIFITGDTVSPDTRTFLQRVNNPCLTKPFRVRDVRDTIAQLLAETE